MRDGLIDALRVAVADSALHEVRISGRGASFCSGGDLSEFGSAPDPVTAHLVRSSRSVGAWMARCAQKITADVHGRCIGAGIELAAFAGHVRASQDTLISLPEVQMGLIPGAGGTFSIARRIGRHRSAYLALSGCAISAQTALEWGLVDELAMSLG
jgi:enoyl-CoA hydratase/carnithine racemase